MSTTSAEAAFAELRASNPALANLVRDQLGPTPLIKLLAFDTKAPTLAENFATNVNLVVAPLSAGTSFNAFLDQTIRQLQAVPGASGIQALRGSLPAGDSARIRSTLDLAIGGTHVRYVTIQYLLIRGSRGYVVSFATLPDQVAFYAPLFDDVAKTFRFA